jgi:4-hydroxy-3-methylbut-2-enyl diphosphate reductase IspH
MRIGIVGGAEKSLSQVHYEAVARSRDCSVEFHDGHTEGRGSETLRSLVGRCDLVVIITRVNSHNAVRLARRLIRERGCAALFVPRFGVSRFESLIDHGFADAVQLSA